MKTIQEDIKTGQFRQAYLLYGEEAYLKQQYKKNLVHALNPEGDTMNFQAFAGKGIDVRALIDLCETMPFFADRRVILLEDTGFFDYLDQGVDIACEWSENIPDDLPDSAFIVTIEKGPGETDRRISVSGGAR